jgi:uncharacterized protein (DUF2384 family)
VTQNAWPIAATGWRSAASIYNSDSRAARAWLFETNTRLDDEDPIDVLRQASDPVQFVAVRAAARQLVCFEG